MIESEVKKLKEQMARNAEHAAEEKESIMSALAAAQARASESENAPARATLELAGGFNIRRNAVQVR